MLPRLTYLACRGSERSVLWFSESSVTTRSRACHRQLYQTRKPLSLEALRDMIKRRLPASVFRCKGIVHSTDAPDRRGFLFGKRFVLMDRDAKFCPAFRAILKDAGATPVQKETNGTFCLGE